MFKYLMDSSAVLAMLFDEPGAEEAFKYINYSTISSVNYCEIVSKLVMKGASLETSKLRISGLIETILPFEEEIALNAGILIKTTKEFGLSLGDRACIGTATQYGFEILTAERIWSKLSLPVKIHQIR